LLRQRLRPDTVRTAWTTSVPWSPTSVTTPLNPGFSTIPGTALLTIAVELAAELSRAMEPDPLLPPQLLPRPWPGTQTRELIARCWAALHERDSGEARPTLFRLYSDITREAAAWATR
jgi:phenylacetic acid degradation operon negative regulatory protein